MAAATYRVEGMSCNHCAQKVKDAVTGVSGVTGVDVDVPSGRVQVHCDSQAEDEAIRAAIGRAGYAVADTSA